MTRFTRTTTKSIRQRLIFGAAALFLLAAAVVGTHTSQPAHAAANSVYFTPNGSSVNVGDNLVVALHEDSGTTPTVGMQAVITYPNSKLQFVSADTNTTFSVAPPDSTTDNKDGTSTLNLTRGSYSSLEGDQTVSTITFKVLASGSATLAFVPASGTNSGTYVSNANDNSHVAVGLVNGGYTLVTPPTPPPPPPPPVTQPTPPVVNPTPGPVSNKSTSVTVAPKGGSGVTVANNGTAQVASPVTVQPTTVQTDGVQKVEYYLNGKLVATKTNAPFTYSIDTTQLKSGTYTLVSKTYYTNGTTKQATQHLQVKNANYKAAPTSYWWAWFLPALVIGGLIVAYLIRTRPRPSSGGSNGSGGVPVSVPPVQPAISSNFRAPKPFSGTNSGTKVAVTVTPPPIQPAQAVDVTTMLNNLQTSVPQPSSVILPQQKDKPV